MLIWFAVAAHLVVYLLVGSAIVLLAGKVLPKPFNEPWFVVPLVVCLGMLLVLATLPRWSLMQP